MSFNYVTSFDEVIYDGTDTDVTVTYLAKASRAVTPEQVLDDNKVPGMGKRRSSSSQLVVVNRTCSLVDGRDDLYTVVIIYALRTIGSSTAARRRLLSYEPDTVVYQIVPTKGTLIVGTTETESQPVETSAGNPFDPPPLVEVRNRVIRFSQIENNSFDEQTAIAFEGSYNKDAITVCGNDIGAKKGIIRKLRPSLQQDGSFVGHYEMEIEDEKPLVKEYLDQDYRYKNASGNQVEIRMSDINSEYATGGTLASKDAVVKDPVKLDGSGGILTVGGTPVYRKYRFAKVKDWNTGLDLVASI